MSEDGAADPGHDPRDKPGRLARNIASVASSQVLTWVFSAVALVIVPRALGPTAVGQLGFATAVWTLGGIFIGFGTGQLISRELAQNPSWGNRVLSNAIPMHLLASVVVALAIFAYAVLSGAEGTMAWLLLICGVAALFTHLMRSLRAAIVGRERLALSSGIGIFHGATIAVLTVVVVLLGYGVEAVALAGAIAAVLTVFGLVYFVARDPGIEIRLSLSDVRGVIKQSFPLMVLGSSLQLYREIDVITLRTLADDEAVGLYAATDRLMGAMMMVPAAVSMALYPTLSRRWSSDPEGVKATLRRVSGLLGVFMLPLAVGALILGPQLATTILGSEFERSGAVFRVYGLVLMPLGWTVAIGTLCTIAKRERLWTYVVLLSAAATIPLDIVLVPYFENEYNNAAIAGAVAFLVTEGAAAIFGFTKVLPGVFTAEVRRMLFRSAAVAGVMAAVVWLLRDLPVVVPVAVGGAVYVGGVLITGALPLGELATLGGPFERLARFGRRSSDSQAEDLESPTSNPPES